MTVSGTCTRFRDEAHRASITAMLLAEAQRLTRDMDGEMAGFLEPRGMDGD